MGISGVLAHRWHTSKWAAEDGVNVVIWGRDPLFVLHCLVM